MRWSYNLERSYETAIWLFAVAFLVFCLVVVGGATRLTGSGLSITEWDPILGVIPPLSDQAWQSAFHKYQQIPQYHFVNSGLNLDGFKVLFWWEWAHRLLARLVGAAFAIPFAVFLFMRAIPKRLIWRCWVLFGIGALQGLVGWWMVKSGLEKAVLVAPQRLAIHLGMALLLLSGAVWTGLEAWFGRGRTSFGAEPRWRLWTALLAVGAYCQCLMGALVAGNQAGRVYNDWPLMNGKLFPSDYQTPGHGVRWAWLHSQAATQFDHRLVAYLLAIAVFGLAFEVTRARGVAQPVRRTVYWLAALVTAQIALGVATLRFGAPLGFALAHQALAVGVLFWALLLAWRTPRN